MKISFHGAARGVTGSCFLIQANKENTLLECGSFQEWQRISRQNEKSFGFKPSEIDRVVLSHAHLDHCGDLPLLYKYGFRGEVITTNPSEELSGLVMYDSAYLSEEEAKRKSKHGKKVEPIYTGKEVEGILNRFNRNRTGEVVYNKPIEIGKGLTVTFFDSGHILGAASILLEVREGQAYTRIVFSGDIGNRNKPIVRDPELPPEADFVIMESTYGNRSHQPITFSIDELYSVINKTFQRGGNVYIPTFAIEGSQDMLFLIREGLEKGSLPEDTKAFLDSRMAISATEIFSRYPDFYNGKAKELISSGIDPFIIPNLKFTRTSIESKEINDVRSGAVVMAGSGMCEGGRILHHLKQNLSRPECTFIFARYAAPGTLARRIIDKAKYVKIYGTDVEVKAEICTIPGFSGHAGRDGLLEWVEHTRDPKVVFLTHGSQDPMESLAEELTIRGYNVEMPELHEGYKY